MFRFILYTNMVLFSTSIIHVDGNMLSKFKNEYFFPHFVDQPPNNTMMMMYDTVRIKGGTTVVPAEVSEEPKIKFSGKSEDHYTLCMASPDIPKDHDNLNYKEYDHWLIINIPGSKINKGEVIRPYSIPAECRPGIMSQFYVFVIYQQPHVITFDHEIFTPELFQSGTFFFKNMVKKYGLIGPISGNYFSLRP